MIMNVMGDTIGNVLTVSGKGKLYVINVQGQEDMIARNVMVQIRCLVLIVEGMEELEME